ncbi:MAG: helix-turn-helix domain-containing protein, partial [Candidatus Limnocylindria bacterium]
LVERAGERTRLTARGRELGERLRDATARHFASLRPIEEDELTRLADLLERAFQAAAVATEPERREHTARAFRFRGRAAPSSPLAALDHAVFGLWMVRDDCHLAAWRAAGIDGPALDVLTRIWRGEARSVDELAPKLTQQRAEDVAAAVERLRRDGRVAAGEPLTVSDEGRAFRERIEDETDRLFFAPWPEDVGEHGTWLEERLREVNAGLV